MTVRQHPGLLVFALLLATAPVAAQSQRDGEARVHLRRAASRFQQLDADGAVAELERARETCAQGRCSPQFVARIEMNLAALAVLSQQEAAVASRAFRAGIALEPTAAPDPEYLTPEVQTALAAARRSAAQRSAPTGPSAVAADTVATEPGRDAGADCEADADCASGRCEQNLCAEARPRRARAAAPTDDPNAPWRLAVDLGVGLGLPYLAAGAPEQSRYAEYGNYGSASPQCGPSDPGSVVGTRLVCPERVQTGFAPAAFVHLAARVRVHPRVAVALALRFQPDAANASPSPSRSKLVDGFFLANWLIDARGYYDLSPVAFSRAGLATSVLVGVGMGQIQTRPSTAAGRPSAAHLSSGLANVQLGGRVEYAFARYVSVGAEATAQFMFPTFVFGLDLQLTGGVHF